MNDYTINHASPSKGPHPDFAHVMLKRQSATKVRRPLVSRDENSTFAQMYWEGGTNAHWDSLNQEVLSGNDIGILVERSGLVVLDCDVKHYEAKSAFEVDQRTARIVVTEESHTEYGIRDLTREVENLGHSMKELATYSVKTKSGGVHLYYWQNPESPLTGKGHRHQWHVDVKASENHWVVAPPTKGYSVIRDLPVAVMPLWLASWLQDLNARFDPVGGRRTRIVRQRAKEARAYVENPDFTGKNPSSGNETPWNAWVKMELQAIADAQALNSNWNNAIFESAANLFDGGWNESDLIPIIEQVARPRTPLDRNLMLGTISSAFRTTRTPIEY